MSTSAKVVPINKKKINVNTLTGVYIYKYVVKY